ncbi:glycosyltransferase family 2 protein [Selenomonas ruminantium]|uniref:glycosyltransferase family 2 protein n=1 Tax=Selenomonas ruminantium TaxID=971 RepID=UPI00068AF282|nr:glycosyltransferase family 2 protein [Selenomonas ruminantium]
MKISACYITKNEEKNLSRSIDTIAAAVDELIVVDTGSTDKTRNVAKSYGAKVYDYVWQNDFSGPRNFAIEQATGDYILFIDADEYFSAETCGNLRKVLEDNKAYDALLIKRYDIDHNEDDIMGEIFVLRAFKHKSNLCYQGRIHEELRDDGRIINNIAMLGPDLLKLYHTGYETAVNQAKAERNLHILQEEIKVADNPGQYYMYMAEACRGVGDYVAMEHYARLDIAQGRRQVAFASRSYRMLLAYLAEQGRNTERYKMAAEAVKEFPELPEFWAELAACQAEIYEYEAAIKSMTEALERDKIFPTLSLEPKEFSTDMSVVAAEKIYEWQELVKATGKLKITTCLIAKNEAQEIGAWLANAAVFSDEIIVVDTGSEDRTVEIAQKAGAKVFSFVWQDDFAAARNYALTQVRAEADWVVFLDADETFYEPQRLRGALAYVAQFGSDSEGIQVPIVNVDVDAWGREIQRFRALRIWRNNSAFRYQGAIHEALYNKCGEIKQLYMAELAVCHTGYSSGRIQQKLNRNLQLIMKEMQEKGEQPLHYRYLADCLYGLHEYELASAYAQRALAAEVPTIAGDGELYRLWLHCARKLKQPAETQLHIIATAHSRGLDDMELIGWQGIICTEMGAYQQAKPLLEQFLQRATSQNLTAGSNAVQGMLAEAYAAKASCHAYLGEKKAADVAWQQAVRENPYNEEILHAFYEWLHLSPQAFLKQVLPYFSDREQGKKYIAEWAVKFGYGKVMQVLAVYLPQNQQKLLKQWLDGDKGTVGKQAWLEATVCVQELLAALVAMPAEKRKTQSVDCHEWAAMLPPGWQRIIGRLYGWQEQLSAGDWPDYLAGLTAIQGFVGDDSYQEYARLALDFSWEKVCEIADKLTEQQYWQAAYSLLAEIPNASIPDDAAFWYQTGRCLYHLQEMTAAGECFARAAEAGSRQPDLSAYQDWVARRERRQ